MHGDCRGLQTARTAADGQAGGWNRAARCRKVFYGAPAVEYRSYVVGFQTHRARGRTHVPLLRTMESAQCGRLLSRRPQSDDDNVTEANTKQGSMLAAQHRTKCPTM